jgi:hypothetical protein
MTDDLIDRIYQPSFVPELWPGILDALSNIADARGGALFAAQSKILNWTASANLADTFKSVLRTVGCAGVPGGPAGSAALIPISLSNTTSAGRPAWPCRCRRATISSSALNETSPRDRSELRDSFHFGNIIRVDAAAACSNNHRPRLFVYSKGD